MITPDRTTDPHLKGRPDQYVKISTQGTWLKYQKPRRGFSRPKPKPRGKIKEFSQQARFRMMLLMNKLDWPGFGHSLFISLTYPGECDCPTKDDLRRHNDQFWRKLEEYQKKPIAAVWRIEWLARKSGANKGEIRPHFHFLLPGIEWIPYWEVNRIWLKMMGVDYIRTEVKRARDKKQAFSYLAKYVAKPIPPSVLLSLSHIAASQGKHWGLRRPRLMPLAPLHTWTVPEDDQCVMFRDLMLGDRPVIDEWGNESFTRLGPISSIGERILMESGIEEGIE